MTSKTQLSSASEALLDADTVAAWLGQHPDFFMEREGLLAGLVLPHGSDGAVSLVERQLILLRERNAELHRGLREFMATARANHGIFERTLAVTSALIDAGDPADLVSRLSEGLQSGFEVDAASVLSVNFGGLGAALAKGAIDGAQATEVVGSLLKPGQIVCGVLRETELSFLFGAGAERIASAAVMPLEIPGGTIVVALGSADVHHFYPEIGTLFLRFLGDTLRQRLLQLTAADGQV